MKAYLGITTILFALLVVAHIWRAVVEPAARGPIFVALTILAAALCIWGARLYIATPRAPTT